MPKETCTACSKPIKRTFRPRLAKHCADCTREKFGSGGGCRGGMFPGIEPIDVTKPREPSQLVDTIASDRKAGIRFVA